MIELGIKRPGTTFSVPFGSYDGGSGASIVATAYVVGDIQIYKDGGTTQRASTSGFVADLTFSGETGIHRMEIDLSDNTTANFFEAGSDYFIIIGPITIDAQTVNFPIAHFTIGYEGAILNTTIATLASQTSFTLEDGSLLANAYRGCPILVQQLDDEFDIAIGYIKEYAITTKTVTLSADPDGHVMVAGDHVAIFMPSNVEAWQRELVAVPTILGVPEVDPTHLGGVAQSLLDLKDFADDGYDPSTDKVQGVVLVDTTTVNSDMVAEAPTVVAIRTEMDSNSVDLNSLLTLITAARMGALDDWIDAGRLDAILDLVKTAVDAIKLETDKLTLVDASTGVAGSIIEEIENRVLAASLTTHDTDIKALLPAALVSGRMDSSVGAMAAAVLTAAAIAANAITATKIATAAITNAKFAAGAIDAAAIAANAIAEAKIATGAIIAAKFGAGAIDAASLNADAIDKIRDGILPTQNVAFPNIPFVFVAASDHVTPVTSASGVSGTRSIDGAAFGAITGTIAEVGNGSYQLDASAADMNGGIIQFRLIATGGTPGAPDDVFLTIVTGGGV